MPGLELLRDKHIEWQAHHFVGRIAKSLLSLFVEKDNSLAFIDGNDGFVCYVENTGKTCLALFQRLFCPPAIGDVRV